MALDAKHYKSQEEERRMRIEDHDSLLYENHLKDLEG
jgi:hypothetical protein